MDLRPLGVEHEQLVEIATNALRRLREPDKVSVVAAALGAGGATFLGVNLFSRSGSTCAEPAAISAARVAGERSLVAIAAVCYLPDLSSITVIGPCGSCRDLLFRHEPGIDVVVPLPGDESAVAPVEQLLPFPELFAPDA